MQPMSNNKRVIGLVVFLVGIGGGVLLATSLIGRGPTSQVAATQEPTALVSPSASTGPSAAPSVASPTPSPTTSPTPSPTPTPPPTPTPKPTTPPGPPATITFTELKLDATSDPNGLDRVITFNSQGAGTITAKFSSLSPQGLTQACLIAGTKTLGCQSAASGTLTAKTTSATVAFTVTLRGVDMFTPTIEIAITFPATKPSATITNARFDGTQFPETNGIQAIVRPRSDGNVHLVASWGGHPFEYEVDLMEQGGTGTQTLANQLATRVDTLLPVTHANPWTLVLQNVETGFGPTGLTATIGWP